MEPLCKNSVFLARNELKKNKGLNNKWKWGVKVKETVRERERERERERGRLCVCKKARKKEPCESLSFVLKSRPLSLALTRYTLVYIPSTATSD